MLSETDSLKIFVVEQILSDILSKELRPGDALLSKRQLALKYSVSRTVIDRAMDSLLEKGYVELGEDDQYKVADFNRYKDLEDLVIFSQYKNQAFTDKEVNEIRELKIGLDLLAVKLIDVPLAEETYLGLKATLAELHARDGEEGGVAPLEASTILYRFYTELAELSSNTFLKLLYLSFKDTNIRIIAGFIEAKGVERLERKADAILEALRRGESEEAVALLNKDLWNR